MSTERKKYNANTEDGRRKCRRTETDAEPCRSSNESFQGVRTLSQRVRSRSDGLRRQNASTDAEEKEKKKTLRNRVCKKSEMLDSSKSLGFQRVLTRR